jgi:hypothetical protein
MIEAEAAVALDGRAAVWVVDHCDSVLDLYPPSLAPDLSGVVRIGGTRRVFLWHLPRDPIHGVVARCGWSDPFDAHGLPVHR